MWPDTSKDSFGALIDLSHHRNLDAFLGKIALIDAQSIDPDVATGIVPGGLP